MKKLVLILEWLLFGHIIILPLGQTLCYCFGYTFELVSYPIFAIITTVIAAITVVLCAAAKEPFNNKILEVLFALSAPLSFINAGFYIFNYSKVWIVVIMLICVGCCVYLTLVHGKPLILNIIALVLSALMVVPIAFFSFIALLFGDFGLNTVVKSVESPNKVYYAEVIDSDQGALGGNTFVDVYENKGVNAFIFKVFKDSKRVYDGDWGEAARINIYWKDDDCLVINDAEYVVD